MTDDREPIHLAVQGRHATRPPQEALCGRRLDAVTLHVWGGPSALRAMVDALGPSDYKLCPACIRYMDAEFPASA